MYEVSREDMDVRSDSREGRIWTRMCLCEVHGCTSFTRGQEVRSAHGHTWMCGVTNRRDTDLPLPQVPQKTSIPPEQDFCNLKPEFVGWSELAKSNKVAPAHLRCWGSLRSPQPTNRDLDKDVRMRRTGILMRVQDVRSVARGHGCPE